MRVAVVRTGGWEGWVNTMATYLAGHVGMVDGLVLKQRSPVQASSIEGLRVVTLTQESGRGVDVLRAAQALRSTLRRGRYDVVLCIDPSSLLVWWLATLGRMRWPGASVVYYTFEWVDSLQHPGLIVSLERQMCRRANAVVNIDRTKGRLQQFMYRLARAPLWVRNGLSISVPVPGRSEIARTALLGTGAPTNAVSIFIASTCSEDRLVMNSIRALRYLDQRYHLTSIEGSGEYYARCRAEAACGLSSRVRFLPRCSGDDMMQLVANSDVGLVLHDGRFSLGNYLANPIRLSQFAACGVPIVATKSPAVTADVYEHRLGTCCDGESPSEIAAALRLVVEGACAGRPEDIRKAFEEHLCFETRGQHLVETVLRLARRRRLAAR